MLDDMMTGAIDCLYDHPTLTVVGIVVAIVAAIVTQIYFG